MPKPLPVLSDPSPLCCVPIGESSSFTRDDAVAIAVRLKALADPVRLELLAFLLNRPDQEACTCELAPALALSEPTVNHHLKKLEVAGFLARERRGLNVHYRVVPEAVHAVAEALHVRCC